MPRVKFENMTPAQKRVAIAKDVIKQIEQNRLLIRHDSYWRVLKEEEYGRVCDIVNRKLLRAKKTVCRACAAGAVLLTGIRLFNKLETGGFNGDQYERVQKNEWFTLEQMAMIEGAFESPGARIMSRNAITNNQWEACEAFYNNHQFDNEDDHVTAIMQNIIKNKGEFIPPPVPAISPTTGQTS